MRFPEPLRRCRKNASSRQGASLIRRRRTSQGSRRRRARNRLHHQISAKKHEVGRQPDGAPSDCALAANIQKKSNTPLFGIRRIQGAGNVVTSSIPKERRVYFLLCFYCIYRVLTKCQRCYDKKAQFND